MASAIPAFYNASAVNIWVEDALTRDYLTAVWPNSAFHYIVAGGTAGAKAMATQAAENNLGIHVFAIVDRDLGADNEARWSDVNWPGVVFRPRVLEVENFLLDEDSLAAAPGNAIRATASQIRSHFETKAHDLKWWMTCKRVLAEVNSVRNQPFPGDKKGLQVANEDEAVGLLRDCTWATTTLPALGRELTDQALRARVRAAHRDVLGWLAGSEWRTEFSGKELFNWAYGQISSGPGVRRPVSLESLAAEVGAIQATKIVPPSLTVLETSIRRRAGR